MTLSCSSDENLWILLLVQLWYLRLTVAVNGFPRTCYEVKIAGGLNGYHTLDPEQDGFEPIGVFCNISSTPVTAVVHHNLEEWLHITGYEGRGSYEGQLVYDNNATVEQVRALILASKQCTYFLHMRCFHIAGGAIFWQSYYGLVHQWEKLGGTFCQEETLVAQCSCGLNANRETVDIGDVGNWPLFPLVSLRLGDTGHHLEYIDFRVGPLVCTQEWTMSRRFVKKMGTRQIADVINIAGIRFVVHCSMTCIGKAKDCVGFNFKRGPRIMCELCLVPYDAPNTDIVVSLTWDHYAIIP